jgi:putative Mn2+ efflux pump MntP
LRQPSARAPPCRSPLLQALRIGLLFGVIEAITPLIGWFAGSVATKWVSEWDHWIAFVLLLVLGAHDPRRLERGR